MKDSHLSRRTSRWLSLVGGALILAQAIAAPGSIYAQAGPTPSVVTQDSASVLTGPQRIQPAQGTAGVTNAFPFRPYNLPGEYINDDAGGVIEGQPFYIAYADRDQPVQTSDWWSSLGLQWAGWVTGNDPKNPVVRTFDIVSEPFQSQFVDLPAVQTAAGISLPVYGMRLWNPAAIHVFTAFTDATTIPNVLFGRGAIADQRSPIVTVGLQGVHPIRPNDGAVPTTAPWTNVRVKGYTDWGVTLAYADGGSELAATLVNGSPFAWFERTQGAAPFRVWAGMDDADPNGALGVWYNQNGMLGVTVTTSYVAPGPGNPTIASTAAYAIYADQGAWSRQDATKPNAFMSLFSNDQATKVVVAALPHNLDPGNTGALTAALKDFGAYAWRRITNTQIHYPPIAGSKRSVTVTVAGVSQTLPLGYDAANSVMRTQMEVTTQDFRTGAPTGPTLQLVFPHHRKVMLAQDQQNIPLAKGAAKYTWRSINGELQAYLGNTYVRELTVYGVLPFMPGIAYEGPAPGPNQLPAEDVYDTLKKWFFEAEPNLGGTPGSFARNIGTYFPFQNNTYSPNVAGIYENLVIADQLSQSPYLNDVDTDLKKSKQAVAAEMRDFILDALKEVIGRWADVYTSGVFQYNPDYNTLYGQPEGYGSVQNLNDKHFHWGYFLRAAAAIGRYDRAWLQAYLPLFQEMIGDVATYDRSSTRYPFLRNFSPFYGHHWANGTANGGIGNDQESTSEAVNFSVGLLELGEILGQTEWRDLGLYLYEEEILAIQQYWFNQDANLNQSSGTFYNGNWPDAFVRYQHNNQPFVSAYIGQLFQTFGTRGTFFGSPDTPSYANSFLIQAIPLSASHLYFGRNQQWLAQAWAQFQREAALDPRPTAYEVIVAGIQARLPGNGVNPTDPGANGALERLDRLHVIFPAAVNSQGEHFAYALDELGVVDTGVVANTPRYGVFCLGGTLPGCQGGARRFTAYNPTGAPITVTFKNVTTQATITTLQVPARAMVTQGGGSPRVVDTLTAPPVDNERLYLGKPVAFPASCAAQANQALPLTAAPGAWALPAGTTAYPADTSALNDSIVCVPGRPDITGTNIAPDAQLVRRWVGTFSGRLDDDNFTRFAIYSNQSLFPGWQLDPCKAGGALLPANCPSYGVTNQDGSPVGANAFTMQVTYDFNSDGQPDRQEQYRMMTLSIGNSWTYENKHTEYKFDEFWPYVAPPMIVGGGLLITATAPFPQRIPANRPATITVEMWGGTLCQNSADCAKASYPVPISVNAGLLTNRASWVRPPYDVDTGLGARPR